VHHKDAMLIVSLPVWENMGKMNQKRSTKKQEVKVLSLEHENKILEKDNNEYKHPNSLYRNKSQTFVIKK